MVARKNKWRPFLWQIAPEVAEFFFPNEDEEPRLHIHPAKWEGLPPPLPAVYWIAEGEADRRIYIGQTTNLKRRISEHEKKIAKGEHKHFTKPVIFGILRTFRDEENHRVIRLLWEQKFKKDYAPVCVNPVMTRDERLFLWRSLG